MSIPKVQTDKSPKMKDKGKTGSREEGTMRRHQQETTQKSRQND